MAFNREHKEARGERERDIAALARFATARGAAPLLGMTQKQVSRAIIAGELPAVRRFGLTLVHVDDIADYNASRTT